MRLFRAVRPDELADIRLFHRLRNPNGIDVKYFTLSEAEAVWYARQAVAAFGDPPYAIVAVESGVDFTPMLFVDRGVRVVVQ
ncbi:hypothetical protein ACFFTM_16915 [Pseudoduganella plicata]|uniref:Uncharacterized protein n=1 Tax=Pseudoduganella plicata TaxID=321984 RepID=A0A4V1AUF0_9BURK|nr:hypothetical protein [Pseudoduganella plicata]QBQ38938.1 hypothetical protein E1742_24370 [Pseudoduganella plicata]GGY85912.1 hypothetical protein GCM10007388_18730 [Pseudoduganella plicata]